VERRHDEEVENAVLENGLHQPAHAGLAVVSFEPEDKDHDANEGDEVCRSVKFLGIYETAGDEYLRPLPVTCRSTWICREQ